MSNIIYVTGFVKSGNTWTSRLLGDALNSPVKGVKNNLALANEGYNRTGNYRIEQGHMLPVDSIGNEVIESVNKIRYKLLTNEKVVLVVRHPFDVVVSVYYYWQFEKVEKTLIDAINCVGKGEPPLTRTYSWSKFIDTWLDCEAYSVIVKYEDLLDDTEKELARVLNELDINIPSNLNQVVERQSFKQRKKIIKTTQLPYGADVQNRLLRKGISGDWVNHFTPEMIELAYNYFKGSMERLGYV